MDENLKLKMIDSINNYMDTKNLNIADKFDLISNLMSEVGDEVNNILDDYCSEDDASEIEDLDEIENISEKDKVKASATLKMPKIVKVKEAKDV